MADSKQVARDKNELTNQAARAIIASETQARHRKTEKLRELRLAAEASAPAPEVVKAKPAKAPSKARKAKASA